MSNRWIKDLLAEYIESFPKVSLLLKANVDKRIYGVKGFEDHTFQAMWELYSQYQTQKDSPEQFTAGQRTTIQRAYNSVKSWIDAEEKKVKVTRMKEFRQYIIDKEQVSVHLVMY